MVEEALSILLFQGQQDLMNFGELRSALNDLRQLNRDLLSSKIVVNLQVGQDLWFVVAQVNTIF